MAFHEGFGKIFGAFQLRRLFGRPENLHPALAEDVDDASGQRRFRTDHGQCHLFFLRKIGKRCRVGDVHIFHAGIERRTAIAGGDQHDLDALGLRQLPGESMFAATRAYYKNFHENVRSGCRISASYASAAESKNEQRQSLPDCP